MFSSLKNKLMASYILLISLSLLIVGGYLLHALEQKAVQGLEDRLKAQGSLIADMNQDYFSEGKINVDENGKILALHLKEITGARITLIDNKGVVLGDSHGSAIEMDNHLGRPEIEAILKGEEQGVASRYSDTVEAEMLYAAFPVVSGGETKGVVRLALPLTEVRREVRHQWSLLFTAVVLAMAVSIFVSIRLSRTLVKPLERIKDTALQVAAGRIEERVVGLSKDEVGQLGKALNDMATALGKKINEVEEGKNKLETVIENIPGAVLLLDKYKNILLVNCAAESLLGVERRFLIGQRLDKATRIPAIIERVDNLLIQLSCKIQGEVSFYYPSKRIMEMSGAPVFNHKGDIEGLVLSFHDITDIRYLEKVRKDFVANISHELRTPVTSVKGYSETLLDGALDDKETAKEFLKIIDREAGRLNRLITELLELSRMESGQVQFKLEPIDLDALINDTVVNMVTKARKKNIKVSNVARTSPTYVLGDPDKLMQVLNNLLENAINYSSPESEVIVSYDYDADNKVVVSVSDKGLGIPPSELNRIFERFYRVQKGRSRKEGGTGLGLAIVKHIIEGHGGKVWAENNPGGGAKFLLTLTLATEK